MRRLIKGLESFPTRLRAIWWIHFGISCRNIEPIGQYSRWTVWGKKVSIAEQSLVITMNSILGVQC